MIPKLQPIQIFKGDSQKITLNVGGITLTAQDKVVFSLREKESNDSPLVLQKELLERIKNGRIVKKGWLW